MMIHIVHACVHTSTLSALLVHAIASCSCPRPLIDDAPAGPGNDRAHNTPIACNTAELTQCVFWNHPRNPLLIDVEQCAECLQAQFKAKQVVVNAASSVLGFRQLAESEKT